MMFLFILGMILGLGGLGVSFVLPREVPKIAKLALRVIAPVVGFVLVVISTAIYVEDDQAGVVVVKCDRCLDNLDCTIEYKGKIFFEFGSQNEEISDELVMLSQSEDNLELDSYIYEFINLSLPIQKVHPDDEEGYSLCNFDMLEKLNSITVNNEDKKIDDPRWDKLKDLIN